VGVGSSRTGALFVAIAAVTIGCGSLPQHRPFDGLPSDAWLDFDVEVPSRNPRELVRSFEVAPGTYGCRTDRTGHNGRGGGNRPSVVTAYCDEGTIALLAFPDANEARLLVACEQPTTRERCEALLHRISVGR
jgi:hypothetical protein